MSENGLSQRVQETLLPSPLYESFGRALDDAYHPTSNPNGIISLGIAENTPMYPALASFLDQHLRVTPSLFGYGAVNPGPPDLIPSLLAFYNAAPFSPAVSIEREHLYYTAGCTSLLDQLFWTLCDEGEGVVIGMPLYGGFENDLRTRGKARLVPVRFGEVDVYSAEAVRRYEEEILKAEKDGVKVRVLVLCTPHNPPGQFPLPLTLLITAADNRCYSREVMIEYMRLCQKYKIHLLSDEIYALTTFPTDDIPDPTPFTSLLSIPKQDIIDPSLCHVLHGMSKVLSPHRMSSSKERL